ncbi:MAG: hypothetical protein Q4E67_01730, partial [Planctomycetia bacterium]|nr:hypothetical protein [Planctomycetia bacterium]
MMSFLGRESISEEFLELLPPQNPTVVEQEAKEPAPKEEPKEEKVDISQVWEEEWSKKVSPADEVP